MKANAELSDIGEDMRVGDEINDNRVYYARPPKEQRPETPPEPFLNKALKVAALVGGGALAAGYVADKIPSGTVEPVPIVEPVNQNDYQLNTSGGAPTDEERKLIDESK